MPVLRVPTQLSTLQPGTSIVKNLLKHIINRGTLFFLLGSSAFVLAYKVLKPTAPPVTTAQYRAVNETAEAAGEWFASLNLTKSDTVLPTFNRDPFGTVTDPIRDAAWRSDRFDLLDYSLREKLAREIEWTRPMATSLEEARKIAESRGAEYALYGNVEEFSYHNGAARLELSLSILQASDGTELVRKRFTGNVAAPLFSSSESDDPSTGMTLPARALLWVAILLVLPLITGPVLSKILDGFTPASIRITRALHILFAVVLAHFLMGQDDLLALVVIVGSLSISLLYFRNVIEL